jgi:hypothetical protein
MADISFARRRYSNGACFCWATVATPDGEVISLGDPWPGMQWPKAELERAVSAALAAHAQRKLVATLGNVLALARVKWGNLDPDANAVFEEAERAIAAAKGG